jgi:hypothetical protein
MSSDSPSRPSICPLDAFYLEHRLCGELDGGVDETRVWMALPSVCNTLMVRSPSRGRVEPRGAMAVTKSRTSVSRPTVNQEPAVTILVRIPAARALTVTATTNACLPSR